MNIIKAAKAMADGKAVLDPMGFRHTASGIEVVIGKEEEPAYMYIDDLLSDKWTVEGE